VVLFGYCIVILAKRKVMQRMRLATLITLFLLASGDIAVTLFFFFRFALSSAIPLDENGLPWSKTLMYKFAMYIVAKYVPMVSGICVSDRFDSAIASGLLVRESPCERS
jgi:hypothetical protein